MRIKASSRLMRLLIRALSHISCPAVSEFHRRGWQSHQPAKIRAPPNRHLIAFWSKLAQFRHSLPNCEFIEEPIFNWFPILMNLANKWSRKLTQNRRWIVVSWCDRRWENRRIGRGSVTWVLGTGFPRTGIPHQVQRKSIVNTWKSFYLLSIFFHSSILLFIYSLINLFIILYIHLSINRYFHSFKWLIHH